MAAKRVQAPVSAAPGSRAWALVEGQHGVVARRQLLGLGFTSGAIRHRIAQGRLHRIRSGVYAAGRPQLTREGEWMAAVLACGDGARLSHESAAALWGLRDRERAIEVSVPAPRRGRQPGLIVHRRQPRVLADSRVRAGIPLTSPLRTLLDLATRSTAAELEALVNQADKLDLIDPEALRTALDGCAGEPGVRPLRAKLDRLTFALTDSELERLFLPIARRAGLPLPLTRRRVNGFRVDFYWPDLGLVVETDGLRYHRTPAQQTRDRRRDQAHLTAGLTPVRFTHAQVRFEPRHVEAVLGRLAHDPSDGELSARAARRLPRPRGGPAGTRDRRRAHRSRRAERG